MSPAYPLKIDKQTSIYYIYLYVRNSINILPQVLQPASILKFSSPDFSRSIVDRIFCTIFCLAKLVCGNMSAVSKCPRFSKSVCPRSPAYCSLLMGKRSSSNPVSLETERGSLECRVQRSIIDDSSSFR